MSSTKSPRTVEVSAKPAGTGPLSEQERAGLVVVLADVKREFRTLLGRLPVAAQNASGLARAIEVERTTCQRLLAGIASHETTPEMIAALPGAQGMRMIAEGVSGMLPHIEVGAVTAAIEAYDAEIKRLAGSQSRLVRRLEAEKARSRPVTVRDDSTARQSLFDAAEAITGRSSDLWLAAHVYTPTGDAKVVRQGRAHGLRGHRAAPDAVPLTLHVLAEDALEDDGGYRPIQPARDDGLVAAFSTSPAPIVRSKSPGIAVVQTVDPDPASAGTDPIDLVFALDGTMTHPATREHQVEEVWALINFPVRRMIFDVYLHRDLARGCLAEIDHHLWRPDFASELGERWQTRFAARPRLELLARGAEGLATDAWDDYPDLLSVVFDHHGTEPADYVGYRCDVAFPVWRTGYRVALDFGEGNG